MGKADQITDKTAKNMDSAGKAAGGLGSAFGGVARTAAGVASGLAVFEGAKAVFGGLGSSIVGFNARMEQSTIGFTTMLGSGEKARSFLSELQTFAAKTPFEFPELVQNAQRMLAMGTSADQVLPRLTAIGDAVAGLGGGSETINRVVTALGQMGAKGKVSAEEMMQLTEAGIPAWQMLADKIGVSIPQAMKMAEQGAISADTAIGAITEGMNQKFGGMMEAQSKTFSGAMSTIKDSVNVAIGTAFQPLFQVIASGAVKLSAFLSGEQFAAWSASTTAAIGSVISTIQTEWPKIRDTISGVWREVGPEATAAFETIRDVVERVVTVVGPILEDLGERIGRFAAIFLPELIAAWQNVAEMVRPIVEGIAGFIQAHGDQIQTILRGAWEAISVIVNTTLGVISNVIQLTLNIIQGDWDGAWQNIKNIAQIAWDGIKDLVRIAIETIPVILDLGMIAAKTVMHLAWEGIKELIRLAWEEIKTSVGNALNAVVELMRALPGKILEVLGAIGSLLFQVGADLIQGFIDGVNSLWNSAISFVGDLFDGVVGAVKRILGVASPSTIMKGIGVDFIQGFIDGTGSMAGALKDFVTGLVSGAVGAAREAAGGVIGAIGGAVSGAAGAVGGAIGGVLPGGGGSGDSVPIERTTSDGRIGYAPGAVTLSEGQVRDLVNQAMAITGIQMSPQEYEGYINRLRNESGFNTGVVNLWDVNARNGTPSIGIGQTIGPTFRGHALPGYGDILNPLHNIIASLRYIRARYPRGAPPPLPGVPYAEGGTVKPGWFTVGERGFELGHLGSDGLRIFSNEQSRALISGMSGGALRGYQGGSHSKGNLALAHAWAAAAAGDTSPGAIAAFEQGMQMLIDYQSDQLIAIEAEERKREELKRLALQISHLGGTTFANEIFTDLSDGVISLDDAISALLGEIKNLRKRARGGGGGAAGGGGGGQLADVLGTAEPGLGRAVAPGAVTVVLNVDGRQFAQAVTPFVSQEFAANVSATMGGT